MSYAGEIASRAQMSEERQHEIMVRKTLQYLPNTHRLVSENTAVSDDVRKQTKPVHDACEQVARHAPMLCLRRVWASIGIHTRVKLN